MSVQANVTKTDAFLPTLWVPTPQQAAFLAQLSLGYSVKYAAQVAEAGRTTVYEWRNTIPAFAQAWAASLQDGGDWYEDQLHLRAEKGDTTAIIVGLKMRERFVERAEAKSVNLNVHADATEALRRYSLEELDRLLEAMRGDKATLLEGNVSHGQGET